MTPFGKSTLRVGLVVNPMAGIGGAVGLQGSDGATLQREAVSRQGVPVALSALSVFPGLGGGTAAAVARYCLVHLGWSMGADALASAG